MFELKPEIIFEYRNLFIQGFWMTLKITSISLLFGVILGVIIGIGRIAEYKRGIKKYLILFFIKWPALFYVTFFRGTPLFVQILLVHFALIPELIHVDHGWLVSGDWAREIKQEHGAFISGLVALSLNTAAYIAEIFRAGILSLDKGQMEAARSLGLNYFQSLWNIILPQAYQKMLPPLGSEAIMLLKDSSLVSAIGLAEMAYAARTVAGTYSRYWEPYLAISFMYLITTMALSSGVSILEKKYAKNR